MKWFRRNPEPAEAAPPVPLAFDSKIVGLRDMALNGWFNSESGELFTGFPIERKDVVLDVGCGDGIKISFCARQGAHVIYVDIDPERVARASETLASSGARKLTPIVSDSDPLPLEDGVASKVIASEVLEHVDSPANVLKELARVGQPGALYFLTVPAAASENLQLQLTELRPKDYFEKPNHIRIISPEEFSRLVIEAGLTIESSGAHGFYLSLWWIFLRAYGGSFKNVDHPAINLWAGAWDALLQTPDGLKIKSALDTALPKTQWIIARKP